MQINLQQEDVHEILKDNLALRKYINIDLRQSLASLSFSDNFTNDLVSKIDTFDIQEFWNKWNTDLNDKYTLGFFQDIVPKYFEKYVLPVTPSCEKIVDVGCGTGILAKIYNKSGNFKKIFGIDINPYPEWAIFETENLTFKVVREDNFLDFLETEKPDTIVLTWTLHHMEFSEQERYVKYIYDNLKLGAKVVILEDSYSEKLNPENGKEKYEKFMGLDVRDRKSLMSIYDWVANRILAKRIKVPIPCAYRTLEEWCELFENGGFKTMKQKFIGFPENRDINTPQSLMVFEKI